MVKLVYVSVALFFQLNTFIKFEREIPHVLVWGVAPEDYD